MKRIGRTVVAVVPEGDQAIAPGADWVLPVVGSVPEIFTPMVYAVASELFAAQLSDVVGEPPFRRFSGVYQEGANTIQTSAVVDPITTLNLQAKGFFAGRAGPPQNPTHTEESVPTLFPIVLRFKLFYGLLFASIGAFYVYLALYLRTVGLSGWQIGIILGMMPLVRCLSQPVWGLLSDIYRLRRSALAFACFGAALAGGLYNVSNDFLWLVGLTFVLSVMNGPLGPLGDALVLEYLESKGRRGEYGSLRLWGALGFALVSFLVGALVIDTAIRWIVPLYALTMIALGAVVLTLPDMSPPHAPQWLGGHRAAEGAAHAAALPVQQLADRGDAGDRQ